MRDTIRNWSEAQEAWPRDSFLRMYLESRANDVKLSMDAPPAQHAVAFPSMEIPTEPIGSIRRSPALLQVVAAAHAKRVSIDVIEEAYAEAIQDTIRRFEETGSPVITDGEQAKPSFALASRTMSGIMQEHSPHLKWGWPSSADDFVDPITGHSGLADIAAMIREYNRPSW